MPHRQEGFDSEAFVYATRKRLRESMEPLIGMAVQKWGAPFHLELMKEECAEFIVSAQHFDRGRCNISKVMEEAADVYISLAAVMLINEHEFWKHVETKLNRLNKRLKNDNPNLR